MIKGAFFSIMLKYRKDICMKCRKIGNRQEKAFTIEEKLYIMSLGFENGGEMKP